MPTTTNYGFYSPPLTGVTPNVPRDTKTLADAVDAALKAEETARIAGDTRTIQGARLHSAATSISNSTWVTIPFDTAILDEIPWTGGSSHFFTVASAGYYQINTSFVFATNGTGVRGARILVSGTVVATTTFGAGSTGGSGAMASIGTKLAAGATVQVQAFQNSGGPLALAPGTGQGIVDITRIS